MTKGGSGTPQIKDARSRILDTAKTLNLMDFDLEKDPKRINRLREILAQLPDKLVQNLDVRLARETKPYEVVFHRFLDKYEITEAEGLLLANLLQGVTAPEHGNQCGISINTVRSHVRRLLEKTGSRSQTDLVRMFFSENR